MGGFVKIYGTILTSSVWLESAATRLVWITMLAAAERHGIVKASVPGLAHLARVSLAECAEALRVLAAPDPYSSSPENEGRRIEAVEGGWVILSYERYREFRTDDQIAEAERKRRQRLREASQKDTDASEEEA